MNLTAFTNNPILAATPDKLRNCIQNTVKLIQLKHGELNEKIKFISAELEHVIHSTRRGFYYTTRMCGAWQVTTRLFEEINRVKIIV